MQRRRTLSDLLRHYSVATPTTLQLPRIQCLYQHEEEEEEALFNMLEIPSNTISLKFFYQHLLLPLSLCTYILWSSNANH